MPVEQAMGGTKAQEDCSPGERPRRHDHAPFTDFEWVFEKLRLNPAEEDLPSPLSTSWFEAQDASKGLP